MHTIAKDQEIKVNRRAVVMFMAAYGVTGMEIAHLAGVRHWTVSRVLGNFRNVAPETRMAVLQAIAARCQCDVGELVMGRLAA